MTTEQYQTGYEEGYQEGWNAAMDEGKALSAAPAAPIRAIETPMNQAMAQSVANGANSVSMPDEIVEVAYWLAYRASPPQPAHDLENT